MENLQHSVLIRSILLIGVPLASVIMLPEFSMDPINIPKNSAVKLSEFLLICTQRLSIF